MSEENSYWQDSFRRVDRPIAIWIAPIAFLGESADVSPYDGLGGRDAPHFAATSCHYSFQFRRMSKVDLLLLIS